MNKKIKILLIITIIINLIFFSIIGYDWFENPELTKMQLFLKNWYLYLINITVTMIFLYKTK